MTSTHTGNPLSCAAAEASIRKILREDLTGNAARLEPVQVTSKRLEGMEEFMGVTNKIFQQFIGNARSGLTRVVRILLKAL